MEREKHEEKGTPLLPPSIHPSLPTSTHSSQCQREREREREGERNIRMSYVHEHHSLSWIVMPLCEQLEWLLCALLPFVTGRTMARRPVAMVRGSHSSNETRQQPECPRLVQHTKHLLQLCIRGTLTCTHIPMRASHTSSVHIPRAHKAAWALKLPLSIYFFCGHTHVTHSRIYPTHSSNLTC